MAKNILSLETTLNCLKMYYLHELITVGVTLPRVESANWNRETLEEKRISKEQKTKSTKKKTSKNVTIWM